MNSLIQSKIGQSHWTKIDSLIWVRQTNSNIFHFIYGKIINKSSQKVTVCYKPISVDLRNIGNRQKNDLIREYYLSPKYYYQSGEDTNLRLALMQADKFYGKHHAMEYQESYDNLDEVDRHKRVIVRRIKQAIGLSRDKRDEKLA